MMRTTFERPAVAEVMATTFRGRPMVPTSAGLAIILVIMLVVHSAPRVQLSAVDSSAEAQFVQLINESRASRGLPALRTASDLTRAARGHSADMASSTKLHHNPELSTDVANWRLVAENVGVGFSVSSLHQAFMDSPGHRANILDSRMTEIGVGAHVVDGRIWVTEVFRLPTTTSTSTTSPSGGVPLWGDWNGDGISTPGRFKGGVFTLSNRRTGGGELVTLRYGRAGDKPVVGDWDGDGVDTIGVVRGNKFILRNEYRSDAEDIILTYGRTTDTPVVGDWDGDGVDTIGVVRGNKWILRNVYKSGADDIVMFYGRTTDTPVVGDWDGNGTDTLGVVRGNKWILRNVYRSGADDIVMEYGRSTDAKMVGDYNGDGEDTLGVVRGSKWILRSVYRSGANDLVFNY